MCPRARSRPEGFAVRVFEAFAAAAAHERGERARARAAAAQRQV